MPLGGRVVISERDGFPMSIGEHDDVVFVRYGYVTPNQARPDELPAWHEESAGSVVADESTPYSLVRITM